MVDNIKKIIFIFQFLNKMSLQIKNKVQTAESKRTFIFIKGEIQVRIYAYLVKLKYVILSINKGKC